jgi:hypothetical protein
VAVAVGARLAEGVFAVAKAPSGPTRKVQSLGQLNTQARLSAAIAGGGTGDADLTVLSAHLSDPEDVSEKDVVWDADTLLQEVAQEIGAEQAV